MPRQLCAAAQILLWMFATAWLIAPMLPFAEESCAALQNGASTHAGGPVAFGASAPLMAGGRMMLQAAAAAHGRLTHGTDCRRLHGVLGQGLCPWQEVTEHVPWCAQAVSLAQSAAWPTATSNSTSLKHHASSCHERRHQPEVPHGLLL